MTGVLARRGACPTPIPCRREVLLGLLCAALPPGARAADPSPQDEAPFAFKLGSPKIWVNARNGKTQDLLVELHAGDIESRIAKLRQREPQRDRQLVEQLQGELHAIKESVFAQGQLEDARVVQDFPVLPIVLVRVPGSRALQAILQAPAVRLVNANEAVRIAAIRP